MKGGVSWLSSISILSTGMVFGQAPTAGAPSVGPASFLQDQTSSSAQTATPEPAETESVTTPIENIAPEAAPVVEFRSTPANPATSATSPSSSPTRSTPQATAPQSPQPNAASSTMATAVDVKPNTGSTTGNTHQVRSPMSTTGEATATAALPPTSATTASPALTPQTAVNPDNLDRTLDRPEVRIASSLQSPSVHVVAQSQSTESTKAADLASETDPLIENGLAPEGAGQTPGSLVSPNLAEDAAEAFGSNGEYIDPTPYDLGATTAPDVILSERSTGCQAVVTAGQQVPNSICPATAPTQAEWAGDSGYQPGNYNPSSLSVVGLQPSPTSARDFYNLTVRPPARLSNDNISLLFPLSIPAAITSAFGWRMHPVLGGTRFHSGTDIGAPQGTPVLAAFDGKVDIADFVGGYGLTVVLEHNKGEEQTLYAHLSEIFVKPGETIQQGEVIGRVGSTGLSTGPHLHFEFRKLTPEGWVVMDAGGVLEQALAQFVNGLTVAQNSSKLQLPAVFQYPGKALRLEAKVEQSQSQSDQATVAPSNQSTSN